MVSAMVSIRNGFREARGQTPGVAYVTSNICLFNPFRTTWTPWEIIVYWHV